MTLVKILSQAVREMGKVIAVQQKEWVLGLGPHIKLDAVIYKHSFSYGKVRGRNRRTRTASWARCKMPYNNVAKEKARHSPWDIHDPCTCACHMCFISHKNTHTGINRQADNFKNYINLYHSFQNWFSNDPISASE